MYKIEQKSFGIKLTFGGIIQPEEDWGYAGLDENGAYQFLEREILLVNPKVKATFFVPVGRRVDIINNSKIKSYPYPINKTTKSREFFSYVHNKTPHELAYHGLTHGVAGVERRDFTQEWEGFNDLDEAKNSINKGKKIFKETIGEFPVGGKYCGYKSNEFSDKSIDETNFKWWCRYYNKGIESIEDKDMVGIDANPLSNYNIKYFGKKKVIDIPTTMTGSLFNKSKTTRNPITKIKQTIFKKLFIREKLKQLDFLLENNLIISIQEHMSPARVDGKRQNPNIFDDKRSLRIILEYLKTKNVWYCTCTELANWIRES